MSDIEALETRLAAALDRVRGGLGALKDRAADSEARASRAEAEVAEARAAVAEPADDGALAAEVTALRADLEARNTWIAELEAGPSAEDVQILMARIQELEAAEARSVEVGEPTDQVDALQQELTETRAANAQLSERVATLSAALDDRFNTVAEAEEERREHLEELDGRLQRLRQVNADLRDLNGKLRKAVQDGLADAGLVNASVLAELEALRADRAAEAAEINALLAELRPMLEEAS